MCNRERLLDIQTAIQFGRATPDDIMEMLRHFSATLKMIGTGESHVPNWIIEYCTKAIDEYLVKKSPHKTLDHALGIKSDGRGKKGAPPKPNVITRRNKRIYGLLNEGKKWDHIMSILYKEFRINDKKQAQKDYRKYLKSQPHVIDNAVHELATRLDKFDQELDEEGIIAKKKEAKMARYIINKNSGGVN